MKGQFLPLIVKNKNKNQKKKDKDLLVYVVCCCCFGFGLFEIWDALLANVALEQVSKPRKCFFCL